MKTNRLSRCRTCGAALVDGPTVDRARQKPKLSCRISSIPTKVCSRGCPGFYWYWLDFGVEMMECLAPESRNIAKRKGFLKVRDHCRKCDSELIDKQAPADFTFRKTLHNGQDIVMTLNTRALSCPQCGAQFMPAQRSSQDNYYSGLSEIIDATITDELIRD